jgi:hypothetical protein
MYSRTRISSTLQLSDTSLRNSPPSPLATTYRQQTKSCGSTLPRCTRTPTRASKAAARTEEYPPCRLHRLLITLNTRAWPTSRCIEATPGLTNRTIATEAAAAHQHLRIIIALSPPMTLMVLSRPATQHRTLATMTWSFPNARCTEHQTTKLLCCELMTGHREFERQGSGGQRYRS